MRYPQTFIDDLRRQADIVRVVQDYVSLKKKGANWMACCPFHKEKTPSFSVSPAKEIFYCFGCHKGGSVFNFVMEMERVAFPEAIKIVAEKSGVPLPVVVEDSRYEARRNEIDDVIQLNKWALEWWEQQLEQGSDAKVARDYLEKREVTDDTRKTFRLGYAPESWDALLSYLKRKGSSQDQIDRSGLVVKREEGRSYDRFRGRLIFPVMDLQGRPIAFGGRTLDPNGEPKYFNSPETPAYIKGRHLFGLQLTRDEIRKKGFAILVEGYLDLIVPYQAGVRNLVASLGTALTTEQVKLLARFARKVVVNYDGDRAGVQAAKKAIETLLSEDLEVKVLVLPDSDPDDFVRESGITEYEQSRLGEVASSDEFLEVARNKAALVRHKLLDISSPADFVGKHGIREYSRRRHLEAQHHIQFVIDQAVRDRQLSNPVDKEAAINEVLPFVRAVRSRVQKREYFDIAMESLRINDTSLRRELWQSVRSAASDYSDGGQRVINRSGHGKPTLAEERLLELLFTDEVVRHSILPKLQEEDFLGLPTEKIFAALVALDKEGAELDFQTLSDRTGGDEVAAELVPMLLMSELPEKADDRLLNAERCLDRLRLMRIDRRIDELKAEMADAQRVNDDEKLARISIEQIELTRLKVALLPKAEAMHPGN